MVTVLPVRAVVVDRAPDLPDVLDDHVHAVCIALAQVASAGVVGPSAAEVGDAGRHVVLALPFLAESVVLELQ